MIQTHAVRLRERGQITIPRNVRDHLMIAGGEVLTLLQTDDLILLTPRQSRVSRLSEQFTAEMDKVGLSLAELLASLAEERVPIHREREFQDA